MGCVRVDDFETLPRIYSLVRDVVRPEHDVIFRAGNDLLLEEYLDGVEFDVDLVMHAGRCVFSSVSQNWPTAEPSFQETGLHCPADHNPKRVAPTRRPRGADRHGLRLRAGRPPCGGQVHDPWASHHRGQRSHGWWANTRDGARRVGGRPRRGAPAQLPGPATVPQPEPQAALPHRRQDRVRPAQRPAHRRSRSPRRRPAHDVPGRARRRSGARPRSVSRAGGDVLDAAPRGVGDRGGPAATRARSPPEVLRDPPVVVPADLPAVP